MTTRWSEYDVETLRAMWPAGSPSKEIGRAVFRSAGAVEKKAAAMRLSRKPDPLAAHGRRLQWQYGFDGAILRFGGNDPATEADLAAWNRLGSRQERAA
jgi:hypothetical protein